MIDPWAQAIEFERDEVGAEIARLLPMGAVSYHNYDLASQVASIVHRVSNGSVPVAVGDGRSCGAAELRRTAEADGDGG